ncbi:hypothetical protein V461_14230 [Pantoea ananatis BRT98]|uniref:hypothetical protein n=1 Tax=Pantoea ananas TaxID=553 RepID=UPI001EE511CB|nr:hypothetical protein [Pantoea ananatis]PKC42755.1 hypothetical protein V461_14230 [Pantoea ananatis BRT98]
MSDVSGEGDEAAEPLKTHYRVGFDRTGPGLLIALLQDFGQIYDITSGDKGN